MDWLGSLTQAFGPAAAIVILALAIALWREHSRANRAEAEHAEDLRKWIENLQRRAGRSDNNSPR